MKDPIKILFVEDVLADAELNRRELERNGITCTWLLVDSRNDFIEGLNSFNPDIIISDYSLPQFNGMAALLLRNKMTPFTPFILVTGSINEEVAVDCMKAGADDYVVKENLSRLGMAVENSLKKFRLLREKDFAEKELVKSEKRLQKAQEIAHIGNWEMDLSSKLICCSDEALKIYGYNEENNEVPLKLVQEAALPEYRQFLDEVLDRLYRYNESYEVEYKIERFNDKEIRDVYIKSELVYYDEEKIVKLAGVIQDITERKQAKEELINAKDRAEESDRLKSAFLHNVSHEIRTPMNAIVGFAALLGEPDLDPKTTKEYIEVIMQSSNHLLEVITDIVDISNIEANLVKVVKNEININSTLHSLCNQFVAMAKEKNIKLTCETGLSDSEALVLTDGTKLNQVLINLISNALKFTDKGQIKIICRLKDNFLEFCVSDTGIGIPKEFHDKIFERFYQVSHTHSRLYEGTGLGLAISKAHTEILGGKIWLISDPGNGTSFFFTIPYEKQPVENPDEKEKINPGYLVFPEKKKILVAEDIESNFKLIRYFLSNANVEIIRAVNGREAVDKFLTVPDIDLILMDIKMPLMDGYEATKLIREKNATIPIIAQTAYADDQETALESGCSTFISKPFDKKGLLEAIQRSIK